MIPVKYISLIPTTLASTVLQMDPPAVSFDWGNVVVPSLQQSLYRIHSTTINGWKNVHLFWSESGDD